MEAEFLKICGIAILCTTVILFLKELKTTVPWGIRVGGIVLIGSILVVSIDNISNELFSKLEMGEISEYIGIMLKVLGISFLVKLCSDICRDCGEGSLAFGVESAGKICILYMSLPIISDILEYAEDILSLGDV